MTKQLFLSISNSNEWIDNPAGAYAVMLSAAQIDRIKALAKAATELDVYKIARFDYSGELQVFEYGEDEDCWKKYVGRAECCMLNVTARDFFWSGTYRDYTNARWETDSVELHHLDNLEVLDNREA